MSNATIRVTLAPCLTDGAASGVRVTYELGGLQLAAGQTLAKLPKVMFGMDAAKVADDGILANDDLGLVPLAHTTDDPTPSWTYRRWTVGRDTEGVVRVTYVAPVRVVTAATTNGPMFDLRAEGAGISGAGVSVLALPEYDGDADTEVRWDLTQLPDGARGVSSRGEGTVRRTGTFESLTYTFYMAGVLGSYPPEPDPVFGMFWLSETKFDAAEIGRQSHSLYLDMCRFFREPDPAFRVFVRKHPFRGNGGSALPGSRGFMFGWSDEETQTTEELAGLLAHETVHNWPLLDGDPNVVSWFNEGAAEYYSILLPFRTGAIDERRFLELLNQKARGYYGNPLQNLNLAETAEIYWQDWRAQRVPYGRGFFHILDTDHRIRLASDGARSVDDVVLAILDRARAGNKVTIDDWLELVTEELDSAATAAHEAMTAGRRILPDLDCLGPRFLAKATLIPQLDTGFDLAGFRAGVIAGVIKNGNAARAGLRDGDIVLHGPASHKLTDGNLTEIRLTLQRGEEVFDVAYEPLGTPVTGRLWEKNPDYRE